jgi:hypothetical protein
MSIFFLILPRERPGDEARRRGNIAKLTELLRK